MVLLRTEVRPPGPRHWWSGARSPGTPGLGRESHKDNLRYFEEVFFFPQVEAHFTCGTDSYGGGSCFHCWSSSQRWEALGHRHGSGEHPPRRLVVDAAVALQNHGHEVHGPEIDGFSAIIIW